MERAREAISLQRHCCCAVCHRLACAAVIAYALSRMRFVGTPCANTCRMPSFHAVAHSSASNFVCDHRSALLEPYKHAFEALGRPGTSHGVCRLIAFVQTRFSIHSSFVCLQTQRTMSKGKFGSRPCAAAVPKSIRAAHTWIDWSNECKQEASLRLEHLPVYSQCGCTAPGYRSLRAPGPTFRVKNT